MALTRRQLLNRIGAAGGYGATYLAMQALGLMNVPRAYAGTPDLPPGSGAGKSVVILGGGIAGLVSAYELRKAGYAVTVLEARRRIGGRVWSIRGGDRIEQIGADDQLCSFDDGHYFNAGAARLPGQHHGILGYARQFGVPIEVMVNVNRSARFDFKTMTSGRQAVNDTRGRLSELLAKAIDKGALDQELTGVDKQALLEFLDGYGALGKNHVYAGSMRAGWTDPAAGYDHPGHANAAMTIKQLADNNFWGVGLIFEEIADQQAPMFQPVGGMDRIAYAIYDQVRDAVRLESTVRQLRKRGNGVRVIYADAAGTEHAIKADYCICTLPLNLARRLDADFAPAVRAAMAAPHYGPGSKVAFESRRFWEQDDAIYGGLAWTAEPSEVVWYPSGQWNADKGILIAAYSVGFTSDENAAAFSAMSIAERIDLSRRVVERMHPGKSAELKKGISVGWAKTPYNEGVAAVWTAEQRANEYALLCKPDGPIYFAGEHMSYIMAWQEGAVLSAHEAVRLIAARQQSMAA